MEDFQMDRLYLTNRNGMSDTDLEAVVNELYQNKMINEIEISKYRNNQKTLISRVSTFLDNIEKKGPIVIEFFYHAFKTLNKPAYDQLPSKQKGCVTDGPPALLALPSEPEGSEVYVKKLNDDFVYLSNKGTLSDVTLQLLVEALANQQVFNPAEKEKHLKRNEELHRCITDFLMDVKSKGWRPCALFYEALAEHCMDLYTSLPSSRKEGDEPMQLR
ncbi:uncharacterized protein [Heptranchias perlo]|uniref:uncharacterized protein n=1 Tax=Heptranchias perlo TaxID=212740 RepID=UPI00355A50D5